MLQASDGWYWKWLAKWKKKSKMMALENENSSSSKPLVSFYITLKINYIKAKFIKEKKWASHSVVHCQITLPPNVDSCCIKVDTQMLHSFQVQILFKLEPIL